MVQDKGTQMARGMEGKDKLDNAGREGCKYEGLKEDVDLGIAKTEK